MSTLLSKVSRRRFGKDTAEALKSLALSSRQSGQFTAKSTRMSKRGSALLRYALINSAWQLTLNDPTFKSYYDLKRSQGLNHYGALGHVAHKLTRVIFKLLTSDTPSSLTNLSPNFCQLKQAQVDKVFAGEYRKEQIIHNEPPTEQSGEW